jgi:hypothetical protein
MDFLKTLKDTPLPIILLLIGLAFILLALSGGISGKIVIPERRQTILGYLGAILTILGIGMYLFPTEPSKTEIENKRSDLTNKKDTIYEYKKWPVVFKDNFTNNEKKWDTSKSISLFSHINKIISDNSLELTGTIDSLWCFSLPIPCRPLEDFYISIKYQILSCDGDSSCEFGIRFRSSNKKQYYVTLNQNGLLSLSSYSHIFNLPPTTIHSNTIPNFKDNSIHNISVLAIGENVDAFVDDTLCLSYKGIVQRSGNLYLKICNNNTRTVNLSISIKEIEIRSKE